MADPCERCGTDVPIGARLCPACRLPNRHLAKQEGGDERITDRPPPMVPARSSDVLPKARSLEPPKTTFDHARIAREAVQKLEKQGIPLDYSPASLGGLDALLGEQAGPHGLAPHQPAWQPDTATETQILLLGSYAGEVLRRRLGGAWQDAPHERERALRETLLLPSGAVLRPLWPVRERLRTGVVSCLESYDDACRGEGLGADLPAEATAWARFAAVLLAKNQLRQAVELLDRAVRLDPELGLAWVAKAETEEHLGRLGDALASYEQALPRVSHREGAADEIRTRIRRLSAAQVPAPPEEAVTDEVPMSLPPPTLVDPSTTAELAARMRSPEGGSPPLSLRAALAEAEAPVSLRSPQIEASAGPPPDAPTLLRDLIDAAMEGEIELLDALLDGAPSWGRSIEAAIDAWLLRVAPSAEARREACAAAIRVAERLGYRPGASEQDRDRSLWLLERVSLRLASTLGEAARARLLLALAAAHADRGAEGAHLEEALARVEVTLRGLDVAQQPELWGRAHRLLGAVYMQRRAGERGSNLEAAVGALRAALGVFDPETTALLWAETQLDLGRALLARGQPADVDEALRCDEEALMLIDAETAPQLWGRLKQALGQALLRREGPDRAASVEGAIAALSESLAILGPSDPEAAASLQSLDEARLALAELSQPRKAG